MVSLLKNVFISERMGDWNGQLKCIELMIPFFQAAGYFKYAKSTGLYVQDLKETIDPVECEKFTQKDFLLFEEPICFLRAFFLIELSSRL